MQQFTKEYRNLFCSCFVGLNQSLQAKMKNTSSVFLAFRFLILSLSSCFKEYHGNVGHFTKFLKHNNSMHNSCFFNMISSLEQVLSAFKYETCNSDLFYYFRHLSVFSHVLSLMHIEPHCLCSELYQRDHRHTALITSQILS